MAANTYPIYGRTPDVQQGGAIVGPSANTAQDGTGANVAVIFQADSVEGGFVDEITLKAVGTVAGTVVRIFLYTGSSGAFTPGTSNTAANTTLIRELSLAAWTSSNLNASSDLAIAIRKALGVGNRLLIAFGTSTGASGNGYAVTVWGMKY